MLSASDALDAEADAFEQAFVWQEGLQMPNMMDTLHNHT
jgi:hypothetical protein